MRRRAQISLLRDGRRLHMNDGPIDLIVEAFGDSREIEAAYEAATHHRTAPAGFGPVAR